MRATYILALFSLFLVTNVYTNIIEDFYLHDPHVKKQSNQIFSFPEIDGQMNAYGHVFLRGDLVDKVVEIKSKKTPMTEDEKSKLASKTYAQLKMFFKPGDNKRTQSVIDDEYLWETLNGMNIDDKQGFWTFKDKSYVFVVTKSAYRSSFSEAKPFEVLFGEKGGKEYVQKFVGADSSSKDELLREELTVDFIRGSNDHFSWQVNKKVFAKKSNSGSAIEFKINNVVQIAKINNDENRDLRISNLNNEIKDWNRLDGHSKEKSDPENIELKKRIDLLDSIEDSPNGDKPDHYIVSYTRDFVSNYKILQKSVSITKVYSLDNKFVSINYTIGLIGHRDAQKMQDEINGTNDPSKASGPNINKVKEIIFTMIDKGFISARNAAEEGGAE